MDLPSKQFVDQMAGMCLAVKMQMLVIQQQIVYTSSVKQQAGSAEYLPKGGGACCMYC